MLPTKIENFALIIGSMKSGTTTLFDYLAQHPEVAHSSPKEPNFFSCDDNFSRGMEWYESLWNFEPSTHKIALEGSTHYTKMPHFPNAAQRIASVEASFKFIYILRDPLERIESQYTHGLTRNWKSVNKNLSDRVHPNAINNSRYATQIEEYYKRFPPESILMLDFQDLKKKPLELLVKVCSFLEVDSKFEFTLIEPRNQSKDKVVDGPMWDSVKPVVELLPARYKNRVRRLLSKRVNKREKLSDEQREFVLRELKDDLLKLSSEYNFDISNWSMNF